MNRMQRAAILIVLADRLHQQGNWCGETHLQKATYFLQSLMEVPTGFDFILYKHGPFSFDLRDELTALRADGLLELRPRTAPYGPSLVPTETSTAFRKRYPMTLGTYTRRVDFVASQFASKGVTELERLATALYVTRESGRRATAEERTQRIQELKPHIKKPEAEASVAEIDRIIGEASPFLGG